MRIEYYILDRCRQNSFFEPDVCTKLYNCLVIKDLDEQPETILFKSKDGSVEYKGYVIRIENDKIFFGYAWDNIDNVANYNVIINNKTYDLCDPNNKLIVGSLVIENNNLMPRLSNQQNFRLISHSNDFDSMLSFKADEIKLYNNVYTALSSCIEIYCADNQDFVDMLNQSESLSIQGLDNGYITKDIKLYIEINGGNPFSINTRPFYKMVLQDLVYDNIIEKNIKDMHMETNLDLRRYKLSIIDQDNSPITHVNGLEFKESELIIDIAGKPQDSVKSQSINKAKYYGNISEAFNGLVKV